MFKAFASTNKYSEKLRACVFHSGFVFKTSKNFKNYREIAKLCTIQYGWFLDISQFRYLVWSATTKIRLLQASVMKKSEGRDSELFKTSKNFKNYWKYTKLCIIPYGWYFDISQFRYLFWSATIKIRLLQAYVMKKSERLDSELFKT